MFVISSDHGSLIFWFLFVWRYTQVSLFNSLLASDPLSIPSSSSSSISSSSSLSTKWLFLSCSTENLSDISSCELMLLSFIRFWVSLLYFTYKSEVKVLKSISKVNLPGDVRPPYPRHLRVWDWPPWWDHTLWHGLVWTSSHCCWLERSLIFFLVSGEVYASCS